MNPPDSTPKDLTGTLHEVALRDAAFRLQAAKDFLELHTKLKAQAVQLEQMTLRLNERDTYVHELHVEREILLAFQNELRDARTLINKLHIQEIELNQALNDSRNALAASNAAYYHLSAENSERDTYIHSLHLKIEALQNHLAGERKNSAHLARRLDASEQEVEAKKSAEGSNRSLLTWLFTQASSLFQRKPKPVKKAPAVEALPDSGLAYFLHTSLFNSDSKDTLEVRGWVFSKEGKLVEGIRARIGQTLVDAHYNLYDEAARAENSAQSPNPDAGFTVNVSIPRGKSHFFLEANVSGEGWRAVVDAPLWRD